MKFPKHHLRNLMQQRVFKGRYTTFASNTAKLFKDSYIEIDSSTETATIYTKKLTLQIQQDNTHHNLVHVTRI